MLDVSSMPLPQLPARESDSHKGDYGRVLVIGGSRGMAGAPALAGRAALRSGAGLVTLATPRCIQNVVASLEPSYMTLGLGEANEDFLLASHETEIHQAAATMDVIALGPGLGGNFSTARLVSELYYRPVNWVAWALGLCALHPILDYTSLLDPEKFRIVSEDRLPVLGGQNPAYVSIVAERIAG